MLLNRTAVVPDVPCETPWCGWWMDGMDGVTIKHGGMSTGIQWPARRKHRKQGGRAQEWKKQNVGEAAACP